MLLLNDVPQQAWDRTPFLTQRRAKSQADTRLPAAAAAPREARRAVGTVPAGDNEPGSQLLRGLAEGKESLFRNRAGKTLNRKDPLRKCIITDSESPSRLAPRGTSDP